MTRVAACNLIRQLDMHGGVISFCRQTSAIAGSNEDDPLSSRGAYAIGRR